MRGEREAISISEQQTGGALRSELARVILVWNDSEYGLIKWHQLRHFGRDSNIRFNNPDLVAYAESFGVRRYRVESTGQPGVPEIGGFQQ